MSQQQISDSNMKWIYGTVKWFDAVKGYGFITVDDGSEHTDDSRGHAHVREMRGSDRGGGGKDDVFVHVSALSGQEVLGDGDKVKFHIDTREDFASGKRRISAIDVSVVSSPDN